MWQIIIYSMCIPNNLPFQSFFQITCLLVPQMYKSVRSYILLSVQCSISLSVWLLSAINRTKVMCVCFCRDVDLWHQVMICCCFFTSQCPLCEALLRLDWSNEANIFMSECVSKCCVCVSLEQVDCKGDSKRAKKTCGHADTRTHTYTHLKHKADLV